MNWLRSIVFHTFFYSWLSVFLLSAWVLLPFDRVFMRNALRGWSRLNNFGLRWFGGIKMKIEGIENLPDGACVIACKHQSTWETVALLGFFEEPAYVLKQELMRIPFWGWYARKTGHISVDRDAGARALRDIVAQSTARLKDGAQVVIFPEGTRVAPGDKRRYHPGIAAIYKALPDGVPVIPAGLNSGVLWGRRSFVVKPGTVTLAFGKPIPAGLDRKAFMAELETRVEAQTNALLEQQHNNGG